MTLGMNVDADLSLDTEDEETTALLKERADERKWSRPITFQAGYQAAAVAKTYGFISFPTPTTSKIWEFERLSVAGNDPFLTLAGVSMIVYITSQVPQDSSNEPPGFPDLLGAAATVPNVLTLGRRVAFIRPLEFLVVCLKGLANSQSIQASLAIIEFDRDTLLKAGA